MRFLLGLSLAVCYHGSDYSSKYTRLELLQLHEQLQLLYLSITGVYLLYLVVTKTVYSYIIKFPNYSNLQSLLQIPYTFNTHTLCMSMKWAEISIQSWCQIHLLMLHKVVSAIANYMCLWILISFKNCRVEPKAKKNCLFEKNRLIEANTVLN